ncbi:hypothetical protein BN1723_019829, partial [Verticillium longisporum]
GFCRQFLRRRQRGWCYSCCPCHDLRPQLYCLVHVP